MKFRSPVYHVTAVPVEKIEPNTYNPNAVAPPELKLLYDSIKQDGYTMPVVCYYDKERDKYILVDGFHRYRIMLDYPDIYARENGMLPVSIIDKPLDHRMASTIRHNRARGTHKERDKYILVDGFHRYRIMLDYPDIYARENGMLPVSIIDKPLDHRMASTIRHNRARGTHNVDLMSNIIKELHELGRSDAWISKHLGMEKDEILRLKQITGLAALFQEIDFGAAWQPVEEEEEAPPV